VSNPINSLEREYTKPNYLTSAESQKRRQKPKTDTDPQSE